jgi:hypothetical protein
MRPGTAHPSRSERPYLHRSHDSESSIETASLEFDILRSEATKDLLLAGRNSSLDGLAMIADTTDTR